MRDRRFRKAKVKNLEAEAEAHKWGLEAQLAAVVIGVSLAIFGFYALQIASPVGLMAGICISGGLSYAFIKPAKGRRVALAGSILTVLIVVCLSMVLMMILLSPLQELKIKSMPRPQPDLRHVSASKKER